MNYEYYIFNVHNVIDGGELDDAMSDSGGWCVLSLQKFPRELKKKLKMKAAEREIDLQELCVRYLETGVAKDEPKSATSANKK